MKEITAFVTVLIPVGLAYDAIPGKGQRWDDALANFIDHQALKDAKTLEGYVQSIEFVELPSRHDNLIALINTWNEATSPSTPRTDAEHKVQRVRAKTALSAIKRNYVLNVDYKELSNGALWPIPEGN